jgi:hypothetical protein
MAQAKKGRKWTKELMERGEKGGRRNGKGRQGQEHWYRKVQEGTIEGTLGLKVWKIRNIKSASVSLTELGRVRNWRGG